MQISFRSYLGVGQLHKNDGDSVLRHILGLAHLVQTNVTNYVLKWYYTIKHHSQYAGRSAQFLAFVYIS